MGASRVAALEESMAEVEIVLQELPRPQGKGTQIKGPLFLYNKTKWHVSRVTHGLYIPVTKSRPQHTALVSTVYGTLVNISLVPYSRSGEIQGTSLLMSLSLGAWETAPSVKTFAWLAQEPEFSTL